MQVCASCGHANTTSARFCEACGARLAASTSTEQRKVVTVLFCDLAGSTSLGESLDPEALRTLLARYFERMKAIVERHGGSVEKFIGDAVMAVFGVPVVHEDDALRAVRAAAEMRDALPELGLVGRIGVTTGEVVTGTAERLATGDAVNVAARLEQAAAPGDVLIGQPTLRLVRESVEVEELEPLALKGKAEPVPAHRLIRVRETPERRHDSPFVGRRRERDDLLEAWRRVVAERRCELVTVVGDAGVGKSRLVAELLHGRLAARIVRARCLPYGDGITYWPVVEVVKQLGMLPGEEGAAAAIRSLLGETETTATADDIAWGFRKTLERAAAEQPLVVVFDDIHWGGEPFLDLVEHVALFSAGVPLLLLCLARPELVDTRPSWPVTLRLQPLNQAEVANLLPEHLDRELREGIARAASGNPLFVHEMLAMADEADGEVTVPPTLRALLAARLDQLERPDRAVLEYGAIEGEIFHRGSVQALSPDQGQVTPRLATLVRKQLIGPDRPQLPGDDGFRFRHLLIRDAAYDALPKAVRADLHARFARWLERDGSALVELDEILGYHLDRACRYREELGLPADAELVAAARARLAAAGARADARQDYAAAVAQLERAAALAGDEVDTTVELHLVNALQWGFGRPRAQERVHDYAARAAAAGDERAELYARIQAAELDTLVEPEGATERLTALLASVTPPLARDGDDLGLYLAARARGQVANMQGRLDELVEAFEAAAAHAAAAGLTFTGIGWRATGRLFGSTPVPDILAWVDRQSPTDRRNAFLRQAHALALAMSGRIEDGRQVLAELRAEILDRGNRAALAVLDSSTALELAVLAGEAEAAIETTEEGCRLLEELGERSILSTCAAELAQALYGSGRLEEAREWAARAARLGASDDAYTQFLWRQVEAKLHARRGEHERALQLAHEAIEIAEATDMTNHRGHARTDLAEVLQLGGDTAGATTALEQALDCYVRKGNVVLRARVEDRLAALRSPQLRP
jgi:class 3 adenylate cyclase/tetratricopeptide (TPR) repeat protein